MSYADQLKVPHAGVKYTSVKSPKGGEGESVYKLDTGHFAAVRIAPPKAGTCAPSMFAWTAKARALDKKGNPLTGPDGEPIIAIKTVSAPKISLVKPEKGTKSAADLKVDVLDRVINDEDGLAAEIAASEAYQS